MTTSSSTSAPPKKGRIGKIIGFILVSSILAIVIGYFVATSSAFFKGIILPQVGKSMNADITVANASLSPFSQVILTKIEIKPHGKETLLKAEEVRLRYNLRDIIGGKITVDEVSITSPNITIVEAADGSSNLDPLTKSDEKSKKEPAKSDKSEKPLNLNIKNISLKNAFVQQTKNLKGGGREVTELSNVNLSLDQLVNGAAGKLNLAADLRIDNSAATATNSAPGSLQAKLAGAFDYKLAANVLPESAKGNLRLDIADAKGDMAELARLAAVLNCDITPSDLRDISLHFEQAGQRLGELRVSGPFSLANLEGNLKVALSSLDRRVLNLVSASSGMDFNSTTISSTNEISVAQKGNSISVNGQLLASQLSLTKKETKETTPVLNLQAAYQIAVDQTAKSAVIQTLTLNGTQNEQKILNASLSKPMPISWGGASLTPEDAALKVAITDLNLADWKSFAVDLAPSGKMNATLEVVSQQAGKQLVLNLVSRLENFSATVGSNQISNAGVELRAKVDVTEMKKVNVGSYNIQLSQNGQSALTLSGSGLINLENKDADLKTSLQGSIAPLLKIIVMPDAAVKSGSLKFDGQITRSGDAQSVKGNLALTDLMGTNAAAPISAQVDLDATARKEVYELKKLQVTLSPTARAKNQLNITGQVDLSKTNAMKGKILVRSDSLDVTPFYDLYAEPVQPAAGKPTLPSTAPAPAQASNEEPEAMHLPVEQIVAEINIGQFYLREIAIKDWRGTAKIEGSRVLLNPFQMTLNSAPISLNADLDLGVKGYGYTLTAAFKGVPLEPLANSFMPDKHGAYQGTLIANANIKGVGTTGASLKKSLSGNADFTFTNANIKIVGGMLKPVLSGVALVLQAPELTSSPVKWLVASLKFGDGKIDLQNLTVQSDVFTANAKTIIPIADVLTNSPLQKVPVNFGLSYALARKLLLTSISTATNPAFVMMPDFLTVGGTLGNPKPSYNKTKLVGTALEKLSGNIPGVSDKAETLLKDVGNIFSGKMTSTNATNLGTTNQPASDQLNLNNVLDLFKKKKKK